MRRCAVRKKFTSKFTLNERSLADLESISGTLTDPEEIDDLSTGDLIKAAAVDTNFYGRHFFPKTCKQDAPGFFREIDDVLERPENRLVAIEAFRGSAKTSKLRLFTSKRISFGYSRTILFVSDAEGHSSATIGWLKKAVEFNTKWAQTFKLTPGSKWTENDIEINHGTLEITIRIKGLGITGQIRGINIDDYRPDLIVTDDIENEENTSTPEARKKIANLFFGALVQSLVPATENPDAKLVSLQTPLNRDALIEVLRHDPAFVARRFGCFDAHGESRWPERFPTEVLLREKQSYIARNQLSIWLREMECRVVSDETASFRGEWLQYWDILPEGMTYIIAIDPAPPRSEKALLTNANTDFQAIVVLGFWRDRTYLVEYSNLRDQNPELVAVEFYRLVVKYRPLATGVESVAYQRVLKWFLEKAMKARNHPVYIRDVDDRRSKPTRIKQGLTDRAATRSFYVHKSHTDFIEQFVEYPDVSHDDLLDAVAIGLKMADDMGAYQGGLQGASEQELLPLDWRAAP